MKQMIAWCKKYWSIVTLLVLVIIGLVYRTWHQSVHPNNVVFLGQLVGYESTLSGVLQKNKLVGDANASFTSTQMKSSSLLELLSYDAMGLGENKQRISETIKKAKILILTIGLQDVISKVEVDPYRNCLSYDQEMMDLTLDILSQNIYEMITIIQDYNPGVILYLVGFDCANTWGHEEEATKNLFEQLDYHLTVAAEDNQVTYFSLLSKLGPYTMGDDCFTLSQYSLNRLSALFALKIQQDLS